MEATLESVTLTGTRTEMYRAGTGPTLLLLMGAGTGKSAWRAVIERLAPTVHCVAFDNRGAGKASDISEPLTVEQLAGDVAEVIEYLDEGPVHVAGVSLGGMIAMRLAAEHPELVKSLTLHSTAAKLNGRTRDVQELRIALIDAGAPVSALRSIVALWSEGSVGLDFELPRSAEQQTRFNRENYVNHLAAARGHAMTAHELAAITSPTLITVGSDDILTTPADAEHLHRCIGGSTLVTIEGTGHGHYLSDPDMIALLQAGWVHRHE